MSERKKERNKNGVIVISLSDLCIVSTRSEEICPRFSSRPCWYFQTWPPEGHTTLPTYIHTGIVVRSGGGGGGNDLRPESQPEMVDGRITYEAVALGGGSTSTFGTRVAAAGCWMAEYRI